MEDADRPPVAPVATAGSDTEEEEAAPPARVCGRSAFAMMMGGDSDKSDAESDGGEVVDGACPAGHAFKAFQTKEEFNCDVCSASISIGKRMLGCRICDWDTCEDCSSKAPQAPEPAPARAAAHAAVHKVAAKKSAAKNKKKSKGGKTGGGDADEVDEDTLLEAAAAEAAAAAKAAGEAEAAEAAAKAVATAEKEKATEKTVDEEAARAAKRAEIMEKVRLAKVAQEAAEPNANEASGKPVKEMSAAELMDLLAAEADNKKGGKEKLTPQQKLQFARHEIQNQNPMTAFIKP